MRFTHHHNSVRRWRIAAVLMACVAMMGVARQPVQEKLGRPDLDAIRTAVNDEKSPYYYQRLLTEFMRNDTTMTDREFQYFYYGTLFQEDYEPYRPAPDSATYKSLEHIYVKDNRSRSDRNQMLSYADRALMDNPLDFKQLTNKIFVYEQNGKNDLARIWQYKLNHLLLVITSSGTGIDPENAWVVVYPQHEYDMLNFVGIKAISNSFEAPAFDYIAVQPRQSGDREGYFFDIGEMLNQYFLKHPSERIDAADDQD